MVEGKEREEGERVNEEGGGGGRGRGEEGWESWK